LGGERQQSPEHQGTFTHFQVAKPISPRKYDGTPDIFALTPGMVHTISIDREDDDDEDTDDDSESSVLLLPANNFNNVEFDVPLDDLDDVQLTLVGWPDMGESVQDHEDSENDMLLVEVMSAMGVGSEHGTAVLSSECADMNDDLEGDGLIPGPDATAASTSTTTTIPSTFLRGLAAAQEQGYALEEQEAASEQIEEAEHKPETEEARQREEAQEVTTNVCMHSHARARMPLRL
jgi:hypothetical protein